MSTYRVEEYVAPSGGMPFSRWMNRLLDSNARGRVLTRLKRASMGNFGNHHGIGEGVSETVIDSGPGYRVYFAKPDPDTVLLLAGGTRCTQRQDIESAKSNWYDFLERRRSARGFQ
ncbi:MAG: type II toxin-antitoxin system RelE/ParE family toxin [Gammaproteobacteria bacterium]